MKDEDVQKKELAKKFAENWKSQLENAAKDLNLDVNKNFRKLSRIIQKENSK